METKLSSEGIASDLRFFTSAELAEILKMHPQVITRKLQVGEISGYKLGKDWRVSETQLHEFLARHSNQRDQHESKLLKDSKPMNSNMKAKKRGNL